jgi:hypothetical protein
MPTWIRRQIRTNDAADGLDLLARRPVRVLSLWYYPIGLIFVVVALVGTVKLLWPVAGPSRSLQINVIKTALSAGAGAGGATAIWLALRRQSLVERTQAHTELIARATQRQAEQIAQQDNLDAHERRVTDLYSRAVEQIGHASAAVRSAGLYSLERLADAHPELRRTVVDVICAYLRMPATFPDRSHAQERQVRLTAQRMLARHLAPRAGGDDPGAQQDQEAYWEPARIDLNGASLYDFDFSFCRVGENDFRNAQFFGKTSFAHAEFAGQTQFSSAYFHGNLSFAGATFGQDVLFSDAVFCGNTRFERALFNSETDFGYTKFWAEAHFTAATFGGVTRFDDAEFHGNCWINEARFGTSVWFGGSQFICGCEFGGTRFANHKCRSSWPSGWRLEPLTDTTAKLVRDKPVFLGIGKYHGADTYRMTTGELNRNLPA